MDQERRVAVANPQTRAAITPTFGVRQHRARHHVAAVGESLCPYAERHRNIAGSHSTSPAISSATPEAHDVAFSAAVIHITRNTALLSSLARQKPRKGRPPGAAFLRAPIHFG